MSLFGLIGDLDDDPLMGGHVRRMNSLMSSFFRDPFADMFGGRGMLSIGGPAGLGGGEMMPFTGARAMHSPAAMMLSGGFPSMLDQLGSAGNGSHVSSMSTVMTMTQGPDGRPQVYQASQTVRQGPNGVRETKKTVADSRTGVKKMSIGRHVYDRGHVVERGQNIYSGEREENEEFINLEEDEAEEFNKEWESKARQMVPGRNAQPAIGYGNHSGSHRRRHHGQQLALPSSTSNAPQPSQRFVGRSSRRSTNGFTPQAYQPSVASTIAASLEVNDSDSEEEPCKKRRLENTNENITNSITIHQTDDEDEDDIDGNDDVIEEVDDDDDEDVDEDDDEVVIDLDSDSVLSKENNKINKQK